MGEPNARIRRIVVHVQVGSDRMAGTDDPLFLGIEGPQGREFRLAFAAGKSLRRGHEDVYVLAEAGDADVNVAHPELNDPTQPAIELAAVRGVYLRKGLEPIPNVRGFAEMDDRLEVGAAEVELHASGAPKPRRFARTGPFWLGLVCGLQAGLAEADAA